MWGTERTAPRGPALTPRPCKHPQKLAVVEEEPRFALHGIDDLKLSDLPKGADEMLEAVGVAALKSGCRRLVHACTHVHVNSGHTLLC